MRRISLNLSLLVLSHSIFMPVWVSLVEKVRLRPWMKQEKGPDVARAALNKVDRAHSWWFWSTDVSCWSNSSPPSFWRNITFYRWSLLTGFCQQMPCAVTITGHGFRDLAKLSKGIKNRVIWETDQKNVVWSLKDLKHEPAAVPLSQLIGRTDSPDLYHCCNECKMLIKLWEKENIWTNL